MKLSEWMTANKRDDDAIAALVGTDRSTISRIRRGKQRPSWDLADKLFKATDGEVGSNPKDFIEVPDAPADTPPQEGASAA